MKSPSLEVKDIEAGIEDHGFTNNLVHSLSWTELEIEVVDRKTKEPKKLLQRTSGLALAGEVVALLGPSGSGKTTLLDVLANRSQATWTGSIDVNGSPLTPHRIRSLSGYVEQEDALIGSLTVQETIDFAAQFALPSVRRQDQVRLVDALIAALGLREQSDTIIGTPLQKGISGGQKRRVSVASQLVAQPKILFLDEPTSGLDSAASYEVMRYISAVAKQYRLIVVASIHQPSTTTFHLFDKVLLLSKGRTCYFGSSAGAVDHFNQLTTVPQYMNPAEFMLDLVNVDFGTDDATMNRKPSLDTICAFWADSDLHRQLPNTFVHRRKPLPISDEPVQTNTRASLILLRRNFIKSYRDLLVYGTRIAMYTGLAIMMGTVWLRLEYTQTNIQPFINALFFGGAFMSFMAVAYVPAIIEDLQMYKKEHANGLYGPVAFTIANSLIGIPWLAAITLIFSIIVYWLSGFTNTASGFWLWVLWLFLDLLAAEALVVLVSTIFPIFVVALAIVAFANGLWMSVGGFLVPLGTLNVFWKYVFHYIDYQAYVFQAMMVNQFKHTVYSCQGAPCMYPSALEHEGKIAGNAVLKAYHYSHKTGKMWEWFGIMLAIIVVYRLLGLGALVWRNR